jgi:hypothetical protein
MLKLCFLTLFELFTEALEEVRQIGHCLILEYSHTLKEHISFTRISGSERKLILEQVSIEQMQSQNVIASATNIFTRMQCTIL